MPVIPSWRPSSPCTWPHAFKTPVSHDDDIAGRIGIAVVWRRCAPMVTLTPIASAQHRGAIAGFVPVGASSPPTTVQSGFGIPTPCSSLAAFMSWSDVVPGAGAASCTGSGCAGSSCLSSLTTVGVYGAAGATGGELTGARSLAPGWYGSESPRAAGATAAATATPSAVRTSAPDLVRPPRSSRRVRLPLTITPDLIPPLATARIRLVEKRRREAGTGPTYCQVETINLRHRRTLVISTCHIGRDARSLSHGQRRSPAPHEP